MDENVGNFTGNLVVAPSVCHHHRDVTYILKFKQY